MKNYSIEKTEGGKNWKVMGLGKSGDWVKLSVLELHNEQRYVTLLRASHTPLQFLIQSLPALSIVEVVCVSE